MAPPAAIRTLPAQYSKFIAAVLGVAIAYLTAYGTTWNLQGFLVSLGAALAVLGVPNAPKPPAPTQISTLPPPPASHI